MLEDAEILSSYASTLRYPNDNIKITKDDAIKAVEIAVHVKEIVRNELMKEGLKFIKNSK